MSTLRQVRRVLGWGEFSFLPGVKNLPRTVKYSNEDSDVIFSTIDEMPVNWIDRPIKCYKYVELKNCQCLMPLEFM